MPLKYLIVITGVILAPMCHNRLYAGPSTPTNRFNVNVEGEYMFSDFKRNPEPALGNATGGNLSQDYRLYLQGAVLNQGRLNLMSGIGVGDKYRKDAIDIENRTNFDYGKWMRLNTLVKHETDEDIFFSGTVEPHSPLYSSTKKYNTQLALSQVSSFQYALEEIKRRDLLLGSIVNENTKSQTLGFKTAVGPLSFNSEYRNNNFDDLLGIRGNIKSDDTRLELAYKPREFFSATAFYENSVDKNVDNNTSLRSSDSNIEFMLKPVNELKLRDRIKLKKDNDSRTGEDINNISNETIVAFTPSKQINTEIAYKREDEHKEKDSEEITSTVNEGRFMLRLMPYPEINLNGGYDISDKESSSTSENLRNTKIYSDASFEPIRSFRFGGAISRSEQKNTFTSLIESDTKSLSVNLQYKPEQKINLFMQLDTTKTESPQTGAFTKTDTASSSVNVRPLSSLDISFRTSAQKTTGSSTSALSKRFLNSLEGNVSLTKNLKLSCQYQFIQSTGTPSSDENLFDISAFYNIGRADFSLRFQDVIVTGDNATDKIALSSNIKYRISNNIIFSFKFSYIDYTDKGSTSASNSYDSTMLESLLSIRF